MPCPFRIPLYAIREKNSTPVTAQTGMVASPRYRAGEWSLILVSSTLSYSSGLIKLFRCFGIQQEETHLMLIHGFVRACPEASSCIRGDGNVPCDCAGTEVAPSHEYPNIKHQPLRAGGEWDFPAASCHQSLQEEWAQNSSSATHSR